MARVMIMMATMALTIVCALQLLAPAPANAQEHTGSPGAWIWPPWDSELGEDVTGTEDSNEYAKAKAQACLTYGLGYCYTSSWHSDHSASATAVSNRKFELQCSPPPAGWSHSWTARGMLRGKGEAQAASGVINGAGSYDQFSVMEYSADLHAVAWILLAANDSGSGSVSVAYGPQGFTGTLNLSKSFSQKTDTDADLRTPINSGNGDKVAVDVYAKTDVNVNASCLAIIPGGACAGGWGHVSGSLVMTLTCQGPTGSTTYKLVQLRADTPRSTDGDGTFTPPPVCKERTMEPGVPPGK